MVTVKARMLRVLGVIALLLVATVPVHAAGFLIFEQGAKAMGMAGAFTAQADDPSALFHNAAGIAFQEGRGFYLGGTLVTGSADFTGNNPYPGDGVRENTEDLSELVPHFYWVEPLSDRWAFGLGLNAPFGLSVEWANKDTFTGRHINTRSALTAIDLNPTVGWRATDNLSLGFGIVARFSEVELMRRQFSMFPGVPAPPPGTEWAKSTLDGGRDEGFGFNFGLLHKYNNSFHWGFQYRSRMEIDYAGELVLDQIPTGIPPIDGQLGAVIPFGQVIPGGASIEFPDIASLGLGFATSAASWLEFDVNWTGWSTFDQLVITIDGPRGPDGTPILPDVELQQEWSDVWQYRLGFRWNSSEKFQWRLGYIYDETPQPERTVSPVLPDANRNDFTFGFGYMGGGFNVDLALMYVKFDERTVNDSEVFYFGTYSQDAWLVSASFGF
jgi:long-chain fatty acid transport protein